MFDDPNTPLSTRDTKVKCFCCESFVSVEKAIYGTPSIIALHGPEHFCPRCAYVLAVTELEAVKGDS